MSTFNLQDIGYAFLKTYYQRMHNDPSKLHHLYSNTAELIHVNYQVEFDNMSDTLPTVRLIGKDNISKFYTRNSKIVQDIKVKIDSCDFQPTGPNNNNILILALGEVCWAQTVSYRFCQTFILNSISNDNKMFDVTNDIIRFIPGISNTVNVPCKDEPKEIQSSIEVEIPSQIKTENESPEKDAKIGMENAQTMERSQDSVIGCTNDGTEDSAPIIKDLESRDASEIQLTDEKQIQLSEVLDQTVYEEISTNKSYIESEATSGTETIDTPDLNQLLKKMNWASKLAKSGSKDVPNATTNYIRADSQPNKKLDKKVSILTATNKPTSSKKSKQFSLQNKDGFFPVYIRNTGGVNDKDLTNTLEVKFGTVKKISSQESFAVVDFEDQKCQQDAIKLHTLKIKNTTVYIEPKTVKKTNSSASTSPSPSNGQRLGKKHVSKRKT